MGGGGGGGVILGWIGGGGGVGGGLIVFVSRIPLYPAPLSPPPGPPPPPPPFSLSGLTTTRAFFNSCLSLLLPTRHPDAAGNHGATEQLQRDGAHLAHLLRLRLSGAGLSLVPRLLPRRQHRHVDHRQRHAQRQLPVHVRGVQHPGQRPGHGVGQRSVYVCSLSVSVQCTCVACRSTFNVRV